MTDTIGLCEIPCGCNLVAVDAATTRLDPCDKHSAPDQRAERDLLVERYRDDLLRFATVPISGE